jgi:hypothetical protein
MLTYKPNAGSVLPRLRSFYERRMSDGFLAAFAIPHPTLQEFKRTHADGPCDYPDPSERIAFWDNYLSEWTPLKDDSIPSAYLSEFDQGLYGGVLGSEVRFTCDANTGWISSMVFPLLESWEGFDRLQFAPNNPWIQRYEQQMDRFMEGARGKFGLSHFILINGLNFVYELVGATQTYMDLLDRPDQVRKAMELGYTVNLAIQQSFFDHVPLLAGGTCAYGAQWLPGRIISESVDPFHLTSVEYFEDWGRPLLERTFAQFDGGITHLHGNGRHLLEAVCRVKGLKALILGDDKGYPPAIEVLPDLRRRAGDMPLIVAVDYPEFQRRLDAGSKHPLRRDRQPV